LKVLILAPNIDMVGGANVLTFKIARYLVSNGNVVEIWSNFLNPNKPFHDNEFIVRNIGKGLFNHAELKKMLGITSYITYPAKLDRFDIIYCHNFPSYFATLSLNFHGYPTVWQCNEPSIILYPLPPVVTEQKKSLYYGPFFTPLRSALRKIDRLAVSRITGISVLSQFAKDRVKLFYNRDSSIIRMGTNTIRFNPSIDGSVIREQYRLANRPCILTVGDMAKRVDFVIKAVAIVKKVFPDVVYMIVGPCDPGTKTRLVDLIRSLQLESTIILTGENLKLGTDLLPFYYAACDVFVFPQPYWSWSMVTIEAMATGKPVIVPDVSGISEIISNEVNGLKIPIHNTELLAKALVTLLKDEVIRQKMGKFAREYVVENLQESQFLAKTHAYLKQTSNFENVKDL
jgi:glycosyltransferase involved in cell wall biosynthesis